MSFDEDDVRSKSCNGLTLDHPRAILATARRRSLPQPDDEVGARAVVAKSGRMARNGQPRARCFRLTADLVTADHVPEADIAGWTRIGIMFQPSLEFEMRAPPAKHGKSTIRPPYRNERAAGADQNIGRSRHRRQREADENR
jgi:hypothetical protein